MQSLPPVSTAPGSEIEGLVAAVGSGSGSGSLLLKVNLGDPRIVALADSTEAAAVLKRQRRFV